LTVALDRRSYVPYYRQIVEQIRGLIRSQNLNTGEPFLSEGELAQSLGVSKMTVRQAFQFLRREGLLVIAKGKRPTIGPGKAEKNFQELRGFSEEMSRRCMKASSKVLEAGCFEPDPDVAKALRLGPDEKAYRIRRLRFADGSLVGLEVIYLPAQMFPGLEQTDLETQSLYAVMESQYGIMLDWSEEELEDVPAAKQEAKLLQVRPGAPLFYMRRTVSPSTGSPLNMGPHSFVAIDTAQWLFRTERHNRGPHEQL